MDDTYLAAAVRAERIEHRSRLKGGTDEKAAVDRFVAGGSKYIVKYCRQDGRQASEDLNRESAVLRFLEPTGIAPVPLRPVADDQHHGFILPYLEANLLVQWEDPAATRAIGQALATLHLFTSHIPYPPAGIHLPVLFGGHSHWIGGDAMILKRARTCSKRVRRSVTDAIELLATHRDMLTCGFVPEDMVIVHGDMTGENAVLQVWNGQVVARLFDFGEAAIGPPELDLARYCVLHNLDADSERNLIAAYREVFLEEGRAPPDLDTLTRGLALLKILAVVDLCITGPLWLHADEVEHAWPLISSGVMRLHGELERLRPS